jgi:hypothetical protein
MNAASDIPVRNLFHSLFHHWRQNLKPLTQKLRPDTDQPVSFARRSVVFPFLSSTGTLIGMIFAAEKVNQRRLQSRFSVMSIFAVHLRQLKKERRTA